MQFGKHAFGIPAGAQLDLLSWMEANNLQTLLFPGSQWVPVVPPVWQAASWHRGAILAGHHFHNTGRSQEALLWPGAPGWGTLSLLRQCLWLLPSSDKTWICPSWHIHLPGTSAWACAMQSLDVASHGLPLQWPELPGKPMPSRADTHMAHCLWLHLLHGNVSLLKVIENREINI